MRIMKHPLTGEYWWYFCPTTIAARIRALFSDDRLSVIWVRPLHKDEAEPVGRPVVLSLGYGKARRMTGVIVGYRSSAEPTKTAAWKDCYGDRAGVAACIEIELDRGNA
jgi:hypothetical protein